MNIEQISNEFYSYLKSEEDCSPLTVEAYQREMNLFTHFLMLNNLCLEVEKIITSIIRRYIFFLN
ncbi:site-specific integrase [Clostridium sp. SHJSY1]|uniref:site-specific integrase n=1 Tax=Clostridium sp. SHJSY1 TaxID=2942483 RepID=UPI00287493C0|nr:site-specific integrase [Clostridium sp. SHJSY1]MDS0527145.1 site-specific integrase [Clostridium sp. SHJSY1]